MGLQARSVEAAWFYLQGLYVKCFAPHSLVVCMSRQFLQRYFPGGAGSMGRQAGDGRPCWPGDIGLDAVCLQPQAMHRGAFSFFHPSAIFFFFLVEDRGAFESF